MSPEAIEARLNAMSELHALAVSLAQAKRVGPVVQASAPSAKTQKTRFRSAQSSAPPDPEAH